MKTANALLGDRAELRAALIDQGYLFFRGLAPVDQLRALRNDFIDILEKHQWIKGGADRDQALAVGMPCREGEELYFKAYDDITKLESFHALAHCSPLMDVMRDVLGETAFPHPLSIARLVFPNDPEVTLPPHQDYPNNQGTPNLTAAWIPLGDCPASLGGLAILKGSHKFGVLPVQPHLGPGGRAVILPAPLENLEWVSADFELGDVLLFSSHSIYAARVNNDPRRMHLSVDFRYQCENEPLTENCLSPHFKRLTWEEIYAGWRSDTLKYYWKDKSYTVVDWDDAYHRVDKAAADSMVREHLHYNNRRLKRHEMRRAQEP